MRIAVLLMIFALAALSGCAAGQPLVTPADHPASPDAAAAPRAGHSPYHYQLPHDPPELATPDPVSHGGQGRGMDMTPDQVHGQGMSHD